jgi:hypothetical protein
LTPNVYNAPIKSKNDLRQLENLVHVFSTYKFLREGRECKLRPKLVHLLAIYIKYGVDKDGKKRAEELLGATSASINSMNLELRNGGYLVKDTMNQRTNHLHPHLNGLRDYYLSLKENQPVLFVFTLKVDESR